MTPRQVLNKLYPRPTKQPKRTSPSQRAIQEMLGPLVKGLTDHCSHKPFNFPPDTRKGAARESPSCPCR